MFHPWGLHSSDQETLLAGSEPAELGQNRTHAADARPFSSALALHRFIREPLELDRKWMSKAHLTLRHYQACRILFRRNPPLSAGKTAPKKLAYCILMVERRGLQDQTAREPVPFALKF